MVAAITADILITIIIITTRACSMVSQAPTHCGHPINVNLLFTLTLFYFLWEEVQAGFLSSKKAKRFSSLQMTLHDFRSGERIQADSSSLHYLRLGGTSSS